MHSKKTKIGAAGLALASLLALTGCGSGQPTPDLNAAAQQTVAVILTSTSVVRHSATAAFLTGTPTPLPPTTTPTVPATPAAIETPGSLRIEPTRNVVYETPSGSIVQEPTHAASAEPTK